MNRAYQDIARRWCILNCWGWPEDVPKPPLQERRAVAAAEMRKAVRVIGITRCLEYWNSDEFKAEMAAITREYD